MEEQHLSEGDDLQRLFQIGIPFIGGIGGQFGFPFGPPGPPPGRPPFGPPGQPDFGPPGPPPGRPPFGPPTTPPPAFTPAPTADVGLFAVDPGAIRRCMFRYTYVWLTNRQQFWFYPVFVGRRSVAGYRWTGFSWVYFGIDLRQISSFTCF
ncbi:hypothetical protein LGQ02_10435 [Bacillus shivajii]|nr:hypothetical protein LGQ02_10435 [Bacillus shivajii]